MPELSIESSGPVVRLPTHKISQIERRQTGSAYELCTCEKNSHRDHEDLRVRMSLQKIPVPVGYSHHVSDNRLQK